MGKMISNKAIGSCHLQCPVSKTSINAVALMGHFFVCVGIDLVSIRGLLFWIAKK